MSFKSGQCFRMFSIRLGQQCLTGPLLSSQTTVLQSPVNREVNALYMVIDNNIDEFAPTLTKILESLDKSTTIYDSSLPEHLRIKSAYQILKIATLVIDR
jgi:hypothetical protein